MFPLSRVPFWHRFFEPQPIDLCRFGRRAALPCFCQELGQAANSIQGISGPLAVSGQNGRFSMGALC